MNALLSKEIRLVLPVYGMALLLAIVPVWLLPNPSLGTFTVFALYPFGFGAVLLALSPFGREFSLNTFPSLLAQPLERTSVWRTKVAVLTVATVTVFGAWCLSGGMHMRYVVETMDYNAITVSEERVGPEIFVLGGMMALVAFSGGLWTTLLFRQVTAPFWFTILLPATVAMVISLFGGGNIVVFTALGVYSVAGFLLARKLFQHAEETAWTGGTILLPHWKTADDAVRSEIRWRRPWAALMHKEFQLHQIGLAGMGVLFAVHLGTLAFHHSGPSDKVAGAVRTISDLCSLLWCVAPLVLGATSVAEERKLGTMEAHLCLPVSSRLQFVFKLLFVVLLGGVLSAALFWTRVCIGQGMMGPSDFAELKIGSNLASLFGLSCLFSGLALIAFYASTLTRNIMQALATSVIAVIAVWIFTALAVPQSGLLPYGPSFFRFLDGFVPWRGILVFLIGLPVLILSFIWLSYRNFRRLSETWRLWRRNLMGLAGAILFIGTATAALYNRAWELLTPLEPVHGTARLAGNLRARVDAEYFAAGSLSFRLTILQPDGRFWESRLINQRGWSDNFFGERVVLPLGGQWNSLKGNHYLDGSNWVDAVVLNQDTVAIRADGTLWVSEKPRPVIVTNDTLLPDQPEPLVMFGNETNWKSLIQFGMGVFLLKTDGTLWLWQSRNFNWRNPWPGLRAFQPYRLGTASDWADIASASGRHEMGNPWIYAWKNDGQAWALTWGLNSPTAKQSPKGELEPGRGLEREESFDNHKWRSLTEWSLQWEPYHAGVREDGTLWILDLHQYQKSPSRAQLAGRSKQVGRDTNWVEVASGHGSLVALKADGTLWRWESALNLWNGRVGQPATESPVRLGSHDDWVAVCGSDNGIVSLAADGSLWFWWSRDANYYTGAQLLAITRKPVKLGDIFGQK